MTKSTLLVALAVAGAQPAKELPHILFLLIDDWGWADASWHRPAGWEEVQTPNLEALRETGVELDRNYVFKFCSPTRSAIQSGRNPVHVNAQNVNMSRWDPKNPLVGVAGIPVNMTGFAQRLAEAGYRHRVFAGKADFGMAYEKQTPMGRGYTDALFYFSHTNDYWSSNKGVCHAADGRRLWMRDLYGTNPDGTSGPQTHLLNPERCWVQNMSSGERPVKPFPDNAEGCVYEEDLFTNFTVRHILRHDPGEGPLLAFHAAHSVHTPLEVVQDAYDRFAFIEDHSRRTYHAMVWNVDRAVGRILGALKSKGMYENALVVVSSDNGGPIYKRGLAGGNNFPLKGGKAGNWEGGIRVNGLLGGGFLPEAMRGKKLDGLVAGWDWYATLVHGVAGLDAEDAEAEAAGLPPIDSIDQWPYLSGQTPEPPRRELPIGSTADATDTWASRSDVVVRALIQRDPSDSSKLWKLMLGQEPMAVWTGPHFPNATTAAQRDFADVYAECGFEQGCLFELCTDPSEHENVAAANPEVVRRLRAAMEEHNATVFAPPRPESPAACAVALDRYRDPAHDFGWWGPFAEYAAGAKHVADAPLSFI